MLKSTKSTVYTRNPWVKCWNLRRQESPAAPSQFHIMEETRCRAAYFLSDLETRITQTTDDHCDSALFFVWNCPRNWNEAETKLCQTSYWNCFETLKCADSLTLLSFNSAYCGIGFRRGLYTAVVGRGVSLTLSIPAISPAASGAALVLLLASIILLLI